MSGIIGATSVYVLGHDGTTGEMVNVGQRVYRSPLLTPVSATGFLLIEDVAYFVYLGRVVVAFTPKHVEFHVSTGGTGAQTAEVGFFSSPAAPNKAAQSLTKLVASGTVDDLTTVGVKRNTAAFATSVAAGTHLWAGIRTAMATNEPTVLGLGGSMGQGGLLTTATSGSLTAAGPWTGALATVAALAHEGPDLRAVLD
jgi:hypothetical protein